MNYQNLLSQMMARGDQLLGREAHQETPIVTHTENTQSEDNMNELNHAETEFESKQIIPKANNPHRLEEVEIVQTTAPKIPQATQEVEAKRHKIDTEPNKNRKSGASKGKVIAVIPSLPTKPTKRVKGTYTLRRKRPKSPRIEYTDERTPSRKYSRSPISKKNVKARVDTGLSTYRSRTPQRKSSTRMSRAKSTKSIRSAKYLKNTPSRVDTNLTPDRKTPNMSKYSSKMSKKSTLSSVKGMPTKGKVPKHSKKYKKRTKKKRVRTPIQGRSPMRRIVNMQEEFYNHSRKTTPRKLGHKKGMAASSSAYQTGQRDSISKYEFLKAGNPRISHKSAKFISTRIQAPDALLNLLDSLFLLIGTDLRKIPPRGRFMDYKKALMRVENINKSLTQLLKQIKVNPSKVNLAVKRSNKQLDQFYNNSIFCDLVTMDYCKDLL